ncbi:GYF domain-containing protein [Colletotrichum higginsianum IMI 349063]|uniref:GYF domain-containing protein n=2 Tax=Colletotrichum higginsianum TaxID=80884 RepID=A0A1B7YL79_COLHI|nr:GYF domain-containing protein [Colletotrichum higginsianum IMI 349063]OBR12796.1 GYF domain-containing protein [Colletotrichum higginsianum IMI 349063]
MPSNLPSSFASAAAGQNASRDARGGRHEGRGVGSGEWARRDGRANGTLTFRRSSTTPGHPSQSAASSENAYPANPLESGVAPQTPGAATYDYPAPSQYQKDSILGVFKNGAAETDATNVFESGWTPGQANGATARGWGKSNNNHNSQDPAACWNSRGDGHPVSVNGLSEEEKEVRWLDGPNYQAAGTNTWQAFSSDVNSPLKPPLQKQEGNQGPGPNGRKASLSHGSAAAYGLASPSSASRPGTRRRETTDSNPFGSGPLASPSATRFSRGDEAFLFGRKNNDVKEQDPGEDDGAGQSQNQGQPKPPFGNLTRSNTTGNPSMGANISSLWGASSQPSAGVGGSGGGSGGGGGGGGSGMGSFGQFALPTPTSTIGTGSRGGSRFANLMTKDGTDSPAGKTNEASTPDATRSWRSRPRTDTDPFGGDDNLSGSAALGGAQDTSPPPMPNPSNIGMFETPVKGSTGDFGMSGLNLGRQAENEQGPTSPSETNPYRSPPAERGDSHDEAGNEKSHGAAVGSEQNPAFNAMSSRGFPTHAFDGSDRSQTSSAGPRGYASGWPVPLSTGTPDRERAGFGGVFGNSLFSPMGTELQSPGLSSIGAGVFGPASAGGLGGAGTIGRSKLGSLFPPAMQAQMQGNEQESMSDSLPDLRQGNPLGAIGRGNFATVPRDTGSPLRSGRGGVFEEMFPSDPARSHSVFGGSDPSHPGPAGVGHPQAFTPVASTGTEFGSTPVRQMVMPDRMRWVYLDPQGHVQGPFSGLEMNDWYKANFFTPDLRVKKVEDSDFEPLGQLIRRIGNSREPFLVPQIGIAHGPPSQAGPFSPSGNTGVIPPLSGVFPSFGRTLTAEEQNNLERRKQEEQQAMAQQRDFMMRQQAITRLQSQGPGGVPGSLHHQHSAHSLQSQPSFGSISSPIGAHPQQQPPIGGSVGLTSGFFDSAAQQASSSTQPPVGSGLEHFREEDLATLNPSERQMLASVQAPTSIAAILGQQPVGAPANDNSNLRNNLPGTEQLDKDEEGFRERLKEFEDIRAERDSEQAQGSGARAVAQEDVNQESSDAGPAAVAKEHHKSSAPGIKEIMEEEQQLSLTQRVQQAQAAAEAAKNAAAGFPMPFPPPLPTAGTPLPAPTAQRVRSNLPEQYNRSQTGTPDTGSATEPPPLAPWAKEAASRKGPSLKEIQEAEARKAAKAEELAAERRRVVLEQEAAALREREKTIVSATGLPTTSTWGNGSPVAAASPWTKPAAAKPTPGASTPGKQKTLADIQREEENRKAKAAKEVAIQTGLATAAAGKRYADLANKPNNAPGLAQATATAPPPGSGWAMVGAGGKVKVPTGPAAQTRSVSTTGTKATPVVTKAAVKPAPAVAPAAAAKSDVAMDEFNKWLHRELSRGLTGVDIDTFAATLQILPLDNTIIADAVYANSKTMHGLHFAEEFIRRKKLAEKGVIEKQGAISDSKSGSWNEVAKKGGHKEQPPAGDAGIQGAGFKVVPTRKKAGKKGN